MKFSISRYWLLAMTLIIGFALGILYSQYEKPRYTVAFSMGYDDTKEVWNKIRVNEKGNVICHKE